ncbi:META domain-containing protein [Streptomyces sp. NPDC056638]|uniref:META domain-containing protein n=1 Tax=Streptomyces sp. NPDC056638 TaxID=3345887 RepID=UPI00368D18D0
MSGAFSGELTAAVAKKTLTLTAENGDSIALTAQQPAPLTGTTWTVTTLVSGTVASSLPAGAQEKAHLSFGKDGSVQGTLGCNRFRGTATVSGSTITFGRIDGTKVMCPAPRMELERELLATRRRPCRGPEKPHTGRPGVRLTTKRTFGGTSRQSIDRLTERHHPAD